MMSDKIELPGQGSNKKPPTLPDPNRPDPDRETRVIDAMLALTVLAMFAGAIWFGSLLVSDWWEAGEVERAANWTREGCLYRELRLSLSGHHRLEKIQAYNRGELCRSYYDR